MLLVDGDVLRRPIGLAGRRDQHAADADVPSCLQDVVGALEVGAEVCERRDIGVRDTDQRGQVEYGIAATHGAGHGVQVTDVPVDDLDLGSVWAPIEPAGRPERVVMDECPDGVAALDRELDEMRADEATGPGDQDPPARVHVIPPRQGSGRGHRART